MTATLDTNTREGTDGDTRILDVRTGAEFQTAHIPGAYNVPLDTIKKDATRIATNVDDPVVLVCQSGVRADEARKALEGVGMTNVTVLTGGMNAYGGDVLRGKEKWALERQVRLVAGSIALGSVLASVKWPRMKWVAAGIGGGLTFAALSNTCTMGAALSKLPYNQDVDVDTDEMIDCLCSGRCAPEIG